MSDYYLYEPSLAAAVIFTVCFAASAAGHAFQLVRTKTWYFTPFCVGSVVEAIGYVGRIIGAKETPNWTKMPYIIQALLLLLGPALYAASMYMVFGRLVTYLGAERHSMIRTKWLTKIFLLGDVASILCQGAGGAILAASEEKKSSDLGQMIIIIGLAIQIIFFGFFIIVIIIFHRRINSQPTRGSLVAVTPWRRLVKILYGTSVLVMIRSIFRVIEYVMGKSGELQAKEVYLYIFDALLMLGVTAAYNFFHPSRIIQNAHHFSPNVSESENHLERYQLGSGSGDSRCMASSQTVLSSQHQKK
ncbi:Protein RTA1-like protein 7 [Colletotrichum chlorophyti]|uniref:Protein RTA1-like protein 7 n=1 Tax=Colletotrichum chlorophyti TaxID=708187 RepID=A0A1Q8RS02_9PEZI|nr:Protein RTA1-like protein 7 [Colletotrichum chlorophyti]